MTIITELENGMKSVVTKNGNDFSVNHDVKESIMQLFKQEIKQIGSESITWGDKLAWLSYSQGMQFRMCPGSWVRQGVNIEKNVILMPCFVNVGAHIGENTMIDSGVSVGSCAYIGKRCHISSNTLIAGVLEPVQAKPVIIEDGCFIGASCVIAEGMHIGENCVIGAGTTITASTRVYNRQTGNYTVGEKIPAGSVLISGTYSCEFNLSIKCAIIIRTLTAAYEKMQINDLLRE